MTFEQAKVSTLTSEFSPMKEDEMTISSSHIKARGSQTHQRVSAIAAERLRTGSLSFDCNSSEHRNKGKMKE